MKNKKHKCKLCTKSFLNGRALGGHMRSHFAMATVPLQPTTHQQQSSDSSSSNSDLRQQQPQPTTKKDVGDEKSCDFSGPIRRRRREKTRMLMSTPRTTTTTKSKLSDSVVAESESETELGLETTTTTTSCGPYKRPRSGGRRQKPPKDVVTALVAGRGGGFFSGGVSEKKFCRSVGSDSVSVIEESVQASTVSSDGSMMMTTTTQLDEEVAMWLVMLSRDKWDEKAEVVSKGEMLLNHHQRLSGTDKFCFPCKKEPDLEFEVKVECSHRAARGKMDQKTKKGKRSSVSEEFGNPIVRRETGGSSGYCSGGGGGKRDQSDQRVFECPDCFKVFGSGQAIGGHKRWRHLIVGPSRSPIPRTIESDIATAKANASSSNSDNRVDWIDLNLPAPVEDEEEAYYYSEVLVH